LTAATSVAKSGLDAATSTTVPGAVGVEAAGELAADVVGAAAVPAVLVVLELPQADRVTAAIAAAAATANLVWRMSRPLDPRRPGRARQ
jgi:orotidine-5'-phosphate decarboxylase